MSVRLTAGSMRSRCFAVPKARFVIRSGRGKQGIESPPLRPLVKRRSLSSRWTDICTRFRSAATRLNASLFGKGTRVGTLIVLRLSLPATRSSLRYPMEIERRRFSCSHQGAKRNAIQSGNSLNRVFFTEVRQPTLTRCLRFSTTPCSRSNVNRNVARLECSATPRLRLLRSRGAVCSWLHTSGSMRFRRVVGADVGRSGCRSPFS